MAVRTTRTTVTFRRPFMLGAFDHPQPAGTYRVVVEEEEIPGLTFLAYHRTATMLHLPALSVCDRPSELCFTSAAELKAALEADEQLSWTLHDFRDFFYA